MTMIIIFGISRGGGENQRSHPDDKIFGSIISFRFQFICFDLSSKLIILFVNRF